MRHSPTVAILLLTMAPAMSTGCASTMRPVALRQPATPPVTALRDVRMPLGASCVVYKTNGHIVHGRLAGIAASHVELHVGSGGAHRRIIAHDDVEIFARIVTMSRGRRGRIGAAIVALISVPFGISMPGDMVIPAAIVGGLIGYNTGEARAEILYQRPAVLR